MPTTPQDRKKSTKKSTTRKTTSAPAPEPAPVTGAYAPTTWGSIGGTEDLVVPSGQKCLVKRPGVQGLIQAGVLHNIDSLSAIVSNKHLAAAKPGGKAQDLDLKGIMDDPEALATVMHTVDRVVCHVVVQPQVYMTPNDVTSRKDGVIYADMVDIMDKMFIFNFVVGGTRDLETFRGDLDESLGSLADEPGAEDDSE